MLSFKFGWWFLLTLVYTASTTPVLVENDESSYIRGNDIDETPVIENEKNSITLDFDNVNDLNEPDPTDNNIDDISKSKNNENRINDGTPTITRPDEIDNDRRYAIRPELQTVVDRTIIIIPDDQIADNLRHRFYNWMRSLPDSLLKQLTALTTSAFSESDESDSDSDSDSDSSSDSSSSEDDSDSYSDENDDVEDVVMLQEEVQYVFNLLPRRIQSIP